MGEKRSDEIEGKMELGHEPIPPYRIVFFIVTIITTLYLGLIFVSTF
jgi:hypothetical protein